jgi:ligand-binding SRPBCC domain-containing protein
MRFHEQLSGPYRSWIHGHFLEDLGGSTLVRDRVRCSVLGGALVNRPLVRPDVERIFDCRCKRLAELFARGTGIALEPEQAAARAVSCRTA